MKMKTSASKKKVSICWMVNTFGTAKLEFFH